MKQEIAVGKQVQVVNQTLSGVDFIEGYAEIVGMDSREINESVYCSVLFDGDEKPVYRWIRHEVLNP